MPTRSLVETTAAPIVIKIPVSAARRTFDPTVLPSEQPRHL
jgi:hypothetical protein